MDALFNLRKVKYVKLKEMIIENCSELKNDSSFNIFINLENIIKDVEYSYNAGYYRVSKNEKHFILISNIFNLAAHYRSFFKYNNHKCNIIFYFNLPTDKIGFYTNQAIMKDYRKDYIRKFLRTVDSTIFLDNLYHGIDMIKDIFEYANGVYLIDSKAMEPSLVPYVYNKIKPNNSINIIISTDMYDMQYIKYGYYIIKILKGASYIIKPSRAIEVMRMIEKAFDGKPTKVTNNQIPFILSCLGNNGRNIERVRGLGMTTIISNLDKMIATNEISPNTDNIESLIRNYSESKQAMILANYKVTDIVTQYTRMETLYNSIVSNQLLDKTDIESLKRLNDEYFTEYPLYIDKIII